MIASNEETRPQVPRAERIARLNDNLRQHGEGGTVLATRGVAGLNGFCAVRLAKALAEYDGFDVDNDPHGERDFGDIELFGTDLLWKIDYYDRDCKFGSNDPADPSMTHRALTVMLSSEY